jgi:hypothetical protein
MDSTPPRPQSQNEVGREHAAPAGEELRLTEAEGTVLRELHRRETGVACSRLSQAYVRLLELSRTQSPIDAVLVAHLAREILSAAPGAFGIALSRERFAYENVVQEMSKSWPAESRLGEPPSGTLDQLRQLLDEHDRTTGRSREGPRALLTQEDRSRAGYIPDPSIDRWVALSTRASGLAHRIRNLDRRLPTMGEARRIVEELTATLLATVAPYFAGIDELDRLLTLEAPTGADAQQVADLLQTASQYGYFFDHAAGAWLKPLASIRRLLVTPPDLVDVGSGYVTAPDWPQGRFLARVASSEPELVVTLVGRVPRTTNPRVVAVMIAIAQALPMDYAARLVRQIHERLSIPLAAEYAAIDAVPLVHDLAAGGQPAAAADLLIGTVDAILAGRQVHLWHLEQLFGDSFDAVVSAGCEVGRPLRARLLRLVRRMGPRRRYPTTWLGRIDRRPAFGADEVWFLANALYRVLLAAPLDSAQPLAGELLVHREPTLRRVALAATGERHELIRSADGILLDAAGWDSPSTTRPEFRRSLGALWVGASPAAREALLQYAESSAEPDLIAQRLVAAGIADAAAPEEVRREWRSQLLYAVRESVPLDWLDRLGPLNAVQKEDLSEPEANWTGQASPMTPDELAGLAPNDVLTALGEWSPLIPPSPDSASLEGLGNVASAVILARLSEFAALGGRIASLRTPLVAAVTSAIQRAVRGSKVDEPALAISLVLDIGSAFPDLVGLDVWAQEVARDVAGTIAYAAGADLMPAAQAVPALTVLRKLLEHADPTSETEERDVADGYDVGMLALNSVRGEATTATIELLLFAHRADYTSLAQDTSFVLRHAIETDYSRSVRAAVGMRLPWLLIRDAAHQQEWLGLLFDGTVPVVARDTTWRAYLTYGRFFRDVAPLLAEQYATAAVSLPAQELEARGRPDNVYARLGVHLGAAHLLGLAEEADGQWLALFYERADDWLRALTSRWIAEQAAAVSASQEVRDRARAILVARVDRADVNSDVEELKATGWIARGTDEESEVLQQIVLPALERTGGLIENEQGVADLIARCSLNHPTIAAKALRLLVDGDPWQSLPHVAAGELRRALTALMRSGDTKARVVAEDVIHTLGARGFRDYRGLLGRRDDEASDRFT